MNIQFGRGESKYGPGVEINLSGDEVATAIHAYLVSHNIYVQGPRSISINGESCGEGKIYVDPSGSVIADGDRWTGTGQME